MKHCRRRRICYHSVCASHWLEKKGWFSYTGIGAFICWFLILSGEREQRETTNNNRETGGNEHKGTKYVLRAMYSFFCASYMQAHMQLVHPHSLVVGPSPSPHFRFHPQAHSLPEVLSRYSLNGTISPFLLYFSFVHMELYEWQGEEELN
jgi:hypothetical protein